ncbi:hypothetical protein [Marinomonas fungiae]|uniref:Flagellar protein FliT n=1 Tax=Marinomonas fungiae TaxID=1137284 RepID=A0A0K6IIE7_9GAMM|nr:hypothetical protein [Marinomonas fungiae]CUB02890.1 hypothetical protein Ga0061065_102228 [Marinomonas fungiae]
MNQIIVDRLLTIRDEVDHLLSGEEVSEIESLLDLWSERDQLLRTLCKDRDSLIEHSTILSDELSLTNDWLAKIRTYSDKLGKDLLSSTRNQKAIQKYRR